MTTARLTALVAMLMLATGLVARAQPATKVWRVAYLSPGPGPAPIHTAFDDAMRQLGYVEGGNLVMERRFLGRRYDMADEVTQEIARRNVDVIVTWAIQLSAAAKRVTSTTPIVFIGVRGPVERGLVPSLARPGANVTGVSTYPVETIDPKLFEVAKELIPHASVVAVLRSSADPPGAVQRQNTAARSLGFKLVPIPFSNDTEAANVSDAIARSSPQLLIAPDSPLLYSRRRDIIEFAARNRLPVVYAFREAVEEGGLMALSTDFKDLARRGAVYVDKILKGAKPADLPVEQPTTLQFVINLKTAKMLGLAIPPALLLRADQVLE